MKSNKFKLIKFNELAIERNFPKNLLKNPNKYEFAIEMNQNICLFSTFIWFEKIIFFNKTLKTIKEEFNKVFEWILTSDFLQLAQKKQNYNNNPFIIFVYKIDKISEKIETTNNEHFINYFKLKLFEELFIDLEMQKVSILIMSSILCKTLKLIKQKEMINQQFFEMCKDFPNLNNISVHDENLLIENILSGNLNFGTNLDIHLLNIISIYCQTSLKFYKIEENNNRNKLNIPLNDNKLNKRYFNLQEKIIVDFSKKFYKIYKKKEKNIFCTNCKREVTTDVYLNCGCSHLLCVCCSVLFWKNYINFFIEKLLERTDIVNCFVKECLTGKINVNKLKEIVKKNDLELKQQINLILNITNCPFCKNEIETIQDNLKTIQCNQCKGIFCNIHLQELCNCFCRNCLRELKGQNMCDCLAFCKVCKNQNLKSFKNFKCEKCQNICEVCEIDYSKNKLMEIPSIKNLGTMVVCKACFFMR